MCVLHHSMPRGVCLVQPSYVSCTTYSLAQSYASMAVFQKKKESMPSTIYARAVMSHIINGPCDTWQWFLAPTWSTGHDSSLCASVLKKSQMHYVADALDRWCCGLLMPCSSPDLPNALHTPPLSSLAGADSRFS